MNDIFEEDRLGVRLTRELAEEARQITVDDGWAAIESRLTTSDVGGVARIGSAPSRRRRTVVAGIIGLGVAAALVGVVATGGLSQDTTQPAPVASPTAVPDPTTTPDLGPNEPHTYGPYDNENQPLVIFRTGLLPQTPGQDAALFLSPEDLQVAKSSDRGRLALQAMFDTTPLHDECTDWRGWQQAQVASVRREGDVTAVDLDSFSITPGAITPSVANMLVQAWVATVQTTMTSDAPLKITLRGQPFLLYGLIDTSQPIAAQSDLETRQFSGLEVPRVGDTVGRLYTLQGHSNGKGKVTYVITSVKTGKVESKGDVDLEADSDFTVVLDGGPAGQYEIAISGYDADGTTWEENRTFSTR